MSSRNIRMLLGVKDLLPPSSSSSSDDDFHSNFGQKLFRFSKMDISSSESEDAAKEEEKEEAHMEMKLNSEPVAGPSNSRKRKKQKGRRKKTKCSMEPLETDDLSEHFSKHMTINKEQLPDDSELKRLFGIRPTYLDPEYDYKKLFGHNPDEIIKKPRRGKFYTVMKKVLILKGKHDFFAGTGISMALARNENNCKYFHFTHNADYQKNHRLYLQHIRLRVTGFPYRDPLEILHVEAIMEKAWFQFFHRESFNESRKLLELCISIMEQSAHPGFNIGDLSVRLEYKIDVNRPFFVALFMYMYVLSIKACHRTALEVAKVLLNLDPTDPLAVIIVIDVLALRAREYAWLVQAINKWRETKKFRDMFNIIYSYALASYFVAKQTNQSTVVADNTLQSALRVFPFVAKKILEYTNTRNWKKIVEHDFFKFEHNFTISYNIFELMDIYARLAWPRFKEERTMEEFFLKNLMIVLEIHDNPLAQVGQSNDDLFDAHYVYEDSILPTEIFRHYSVIQPLGELLIERPFPPISIGLATNPLPPRGGISLYYNDM